MYQRFAMAFKILRPQSEDEAHDEAQHLVGDQEEDAREDHHHEHHGGRDHGLLARGPGNLRALGAHLLDEFAWIRLRHVAFRSLFRPCLVCRPARRAPRGLAARISCGAKRFSLAPPGPTIAGMPRPITQVSGLVDALCEPVWPAPSPRRANGVGDGDAATPSYVTAASAPPCRLPTGR